MRAAAALVCDQDPAKLEAHKDKGYALIMTASRAAPRAATAAPATGAPRATAEPAAETV